MAQVARKSFLTTLEVAKPKIKVNVELGERGLSILKGDFLPSDTILEVLKGVIAGLEGENHVNDFIVWSRGMELTLTDKLKDYIQDGCVALTIARFKDVVIIPKQQMENASSVIISKEEMQDPSKVKILLRFALNVGKDRPAPLVLTVNTSPLEDFSRDGWHCLEQQEDIKQITAKEELNGYRFFLAFERMESGEIKVNCIPYYFPKYDDLQSMFESQDISSVVVKGTVNDVPVQFTIQGRENLMDLSEPLRIMNMDGTLNEYNGHLTFERKYCLDYRVDRVRIVYKSPSVKHHVFETDMVNPDMDGAW